MIRAQGTRTLSICIRIRRGGHPLTRRGDHQSHTRRDTHEPERCGFGYRSQRSRGSVVGVRIEESGSHDVRYVEDVGEAVVVEVALCPGCGEACVDLAATEKVGDVDDVKLPVKVRVAWGRVAERHRAVTVVEPTDSARATARCRRARLDTGGSVPRATSATSAQADVQVERGKPLGDGEQTVPNIDDTTRAGLIEL